MKSTFALLSLFGTVALAGGVTEKIAPKDSYPQGCSKAFSGNFQVTVATIKEAAKRDVHQHMKRASCGSDGALLLTLEDGVLTDAKNRTGYIASNYQFQFDGPPQAGAIYTAGFSICGNDSMALGDTTTWYQCKSGDFYNLYDRNWAAQCEPVQIIAMSCGDSSSGGVHESSDGQVVATQVITTTIVKPLSDGQPQVLTTTIPVPICQIGDGQIQGHTTPCASITPTTAATVPHNTGVPVSQFSDGQIQVTTPAPTATEPATTAPAATEPATTAPAATEPATTAPAATEPATTAPAATEPGTTEQATTPAVTAPVGSATTPVASGSFKTTTSKGGNSTVQTSTGTGSASVTGSDITTAPGSSASTTAVSVSEGLRISAGSMAAVAASVLAAYMAL